MRKLLCLLLTLSLFFTSGCIFDAEEKNAEPVNKGITTSEQGVAENREKVLPEGASGNKNTTSVPGLSAAQATPTPAGDPAPAATQQPVLAETKDKTAVMALQDQSTGASIVLYYQDAEGNIVPLSRRIGKQEGIAKAAVSGLIDSAITREEIEYYGVYPVIPQGTQVLGINVVNGIATIDFNNKILNYKTEAAERNIISSIVYTATQFKSIKGVKIWVDGKPVNKLKFNTVLSGVLNRQNVLVNSTRLNINPEMGKTDIYVIKSADEKHSYAIPVSVEHSRIKDEQIPGKIVELLAQDYSSRKLYSAIPQKTKLLEYGIKGGVLTLNFNSEIRGYSGSAREEALIRQLLYSVKQIEGVEKLKILVNGQEAVLPEGTELIGNITIPEVINTIIEDQAE